MVLSLAVSNKWHVRQLDVKNAFRHGYLNDVVYLRHPPGFVDPQKPNYVCLLLKSLHRLKHAPCSWFHHFPVLFTLSVLEGHILTPLFLYSPLRAHIYVNVIIIIGNNLELLIKLYEV